MSRTTTLAMLTALPVAVLWVLRADWWGWQFRIVGLSGRAA